MNYFHVIIIIVCFILLYIYLKGFNSESATFSIHLDSAVNSSDSNVYMFKNDKCIKYNIDKTTNIFTKIQGYPKKISTEFKGVVENITSSFLLKKNILALLSSTKIYEYNLLTNQLIDGFPKLLDKYYHHFFVNANCVVPYKKKQLIVFNGNEFGIYTKNTKTIVIKDISGNLDDFFININAGIRWGHDKHNDIFYFFKGLKEITYKILKKNTNFTHGKIHTNEREISSKTWTGIDLLLNLNTQKELCPPEYTLKSTPDSNSMFCINNEGNKCSLNNDNTYINCKLLCTPPFASTGGIKYNEFVLFKIYPNNYLGDNEYPLQWSKDNIYVIEQDTGCIINSDEKQVLWGDQIKLKNVSTQKYLSLSSDNDTNIYQLIKPSTLNVHNNKYISDKDPIKLCINSDTDQCIDVFQNGIHDTDAVITVYRLKTVELDKLIKNIRSTNINKPVYTNDYDDDDENYTTHKKSPDEIPESESYCNINGTDYRGTMDKSLSGSNCMNWSHIHKISSKDTIDYGVGDHNYCRNPPQFNKNEQQLKDKTWCYINNNTTEECDIGPPNQKCDTDDNDIGDNDIGDNDIGDNDIGDNDIGDNTVNSYIKTNDIEKYCNPSGSDYRGTVNWTSDNIQCKMWPSWLYNKDDGIGEHNFCRNPDGKKRRPWCLIDDKEDKLYGECNISKVSTVCNPVKDIHLETYYEQDGSDYRGTQSSTFLGNKCINWDSENLGSKRISNLKHNYCRNPANNKRKVPWCYITDGTEEYCEIPRSDSRHMNINKILCAFSLPEVNMYYLFRNIIVNSNKYIIYNAVSLSTHESLMIGIVNDITWPGLSFKEHIDAAYYYNNIIYFFNGPNIVKYNININNKKINHMKSISTNMGYEFPNLDFKNGIDSIIDKGNGIIYILKDNNYVTFNFNSGTQISPIANQFNKDVIQYLSIHSVDASVTFNNGNAVLFKDNYFVEVENIDSNVPTQINNVPILIKNRYKLFWVIDLNNPIFNKQKVLVNKTNILDNFKIINEIRNSGGLESYIKKKKINVVAIAEKLDINLERLSEIIESGIFNLNMDNKIKTYNNVIK